SGRADLAVHGEPAIVANGAGGGNLSAEGGGEPLREFNVFLFFDPAADGDDDFGLRQVDGLLGFLEPVFRLIAGSGVEGDGEGHDRRGGGRGPGLISPKRTILKRSNPRS